MTNILKFGEKLKRRKKNPNNKCVALLKTRSPRKLMKSTVHILMKKHNTF